MKYVWLIVGALLMGGCATAPQVAVSHAPTVYPQTTATVYAAPKQATPPKKMKVESPAPIELLPRTDFIQDWVW